MDIVINEYMINCIMNNFTYFQSYFQMYLFLFNFFLFGRISPPYGRLYERNLKVVTILQLSYILKANSPIQLPNKKVKKKKKALSIFL